LALQLATMPSLPSVGIARLMTIGNVLARTGVALGILSAMSVYIVHVVFQTYLQPLLELAPVASSETIFLVSLF
jgi:hypothetical protein